MKGVEALRVGIWLAVAADVFILAAVAFALPADQAAFKAIENLDSDADGATNLKEIEAGMLPGDPSSKPGK